MFRAISLAVVEPWIAFCSRWLGRPLQGDNVAVLACSKRRYLDDKFQGHAGMARIGGMGTPSEWFRSTDGIKFGLEVTPEIETWWSEVIAGPYGLTPLAVGEELLRGLPSETQLEYYGFDPAAGVFKVAMRCEEGASLAFLAGDSVYMETDPRRIHIDLVTVRPDHQGRGFGTQILANAYQVARHLEVPKLTLDAKLELGPWVWAKFGFVPSMQSWADLKQPLLDKLDGLGKMVPDDLADDVRRLVALPDPRAVWAIAELHHIVMSRPRPPSDDPPRDVPLGLALLADSGVAWYGELDFSDVEAMDIFLDQIGEVSR